MQPLAPVPAPDRADPERQDAAGRLPAQQEVVAPDDGNVEHPVAHGQARVHDADEVVLGARPDRVDQHLGMSAAPDHDQRLRHARSLITRATSGTSSGSRPTLHGRFTLRAW